MGPVRPDPRRIPRRAGEGPVLAFHGERQPGIATPAQARLVFGAFDLTAPDAAGALLRDWSAVAARLMAEPPGTRLTVTFGLGPGVRYGGRRPVALAPLPPLPGDALDPAWCGGDLCVQVCGDDGTSVAAAFADLVAVAAGAAGVRWSQPGFLDRPANAASPRDLLGFRDGTNNIRTPYDRDRHVWVGPGDRTWMRGGTYLVVRRIRLRLDEWDALPVARQEEIIGRHKASGAPLGGRLEYERQDFSLVAPDAHVRLAAPRFNAGVRLLRRSYNYPGGLLFAAYQRDPRRQFVPVARQLAGHDALAGFAEPVGSAVLRCRRVRGQGGYVGERLFDPKLS
jgi:deferrochelatase/peroxidase EfeB